MRTRGLRWRDEHSRPQRASLRAALAVSGLSAAVGCGAATTPTTTTGNTNVHATDNSDGQRTAETSTTATPDAPEANEVCDSSLETLSESCCAQSPGRGWDASLERCLFTAVPGPFVPPSMVD